MFGRRRASAPTQPRRSTPLGYHTETVLVADPDVPAIGRVRALNYRIGLGLQGYAGTPVDYDRGDPARSLTEVIAPLSSPTASIAHVGRIADPLTGAPTPEFADLPTSDPALDPYMAQMWERVTRR